MQSKTWLNFLTHFSADQNDTQSRLQESYNLWSHSDVDFQMFVMLDYIREVTSVQRSRVSVGYCGSFEHLLFLLSNWCDSAQEAGSNSSVLTLDTDTLPLDY